MSDSIPFADQTNSCAPDLRASRTDPGAGLRKREPQREKDETGTRTCESTYAYLSSRHCKSIQRHSFLAIRISLLDLLYIVFLVLLQAIDTVASSTSVTHPLLGLYNSSVAQLQGSPGLQTKDPSNSSLPSLLSASIQNSLENGICLNNNNISKGQNDLGSGSGKNMW